ncbi:MAG: tRNA-guanine transglycosylase DpdA [Candidatus Competibacter sp.]|nr:tRNA-guanine transglycosylase DpdA [Candidatus Competibacter sp.]
MRLLILTSCTGEKAVRDDRGLTLADFRQGPDHVRTREAELADRLMPAESLYTGLQHARLMRGVRAAHACSTLQPELWILSAGYGLVPGDRKLAPYEATFLGMKKAEAKAWAVRLGIAPAVRQMLGQPYDLGLVLLGDDYLAACQWETVPALGGPTLLFCGQRAARRLPALPNLHPVALANADAKRFACGLVGLKGEVAARLLERLAARPSELADWLAAPERVLGTLTGAAPGATLRAAARAKPVVDQVIALPDSWRNKPHRAKLRYFIPEWDDLVDPDYDFETDTHSGGSGDWSNEVYAHQMYPEPNYDGILISKVVAEKSKSKKDRINRLGVHRYLRVPREFPIMGDCGAFGYIMEDKPPYTTAEILDYYTRLDFDYGVSIDHLIVTATEHQKRERYQLTIHNAEEFLVEHRKRGLAWTPIGAVQGWDARSYAEAARQYVAMGYPYIALGGLVRTSTVEILRVLEEVHQVVPEHVPMHLFGLARIKALNDFARLGVRSVDSASFLRRAWMGTGQNYLTADGQLYAAIRIPRAEKSFRAKRMVSEGRADFERVKRLELACFQTLLAYDRGEASLETTLDTLHEYDQMITLDRSDNRATLRRTLEAQPWKSCSCTLCRQDGIQVIIFGGNNRNRRRGFHNIYVFYRLLQQVLAGERIGLMEAPEDESSEPDRQLLLFGT